jgi:hypothetical protein
MSRMTTAELKAKVKEQWKLACEYDGIDEDEKFVCFSSGNPHMKEYDSLMRKHQLVRRVDKIGTVGTPRGCRRKR